MYFYSGLDTCRRANKVNVFGVALRLGKMELVERRSAAKTQFLRKRRTSLAAKGQPRHSNTLVNTLNRQPDNCEELHGRGEKSRQGDKIDDRRPSTSAAANPETTRHEYWVTALGRGQTLRAFLFAFRPTLLHRQR